MARQASKGSRKRSESRRQSAKGKGRAAKAESTSARRSKAASRAKRKRPTASTSRSVAPQRSRHNGNGAQSQATRRERIVDSPKSALSILKHDHNELRHMLGELEAAQSPDKRERLLDAIESEVKRHSRVEEEIVYPAFKEAVQSKKDEHLFYEALEEHHIVDLVLPEIKHEEPSSETFAAKAKVLKDLIEHHAMEEETEMFSRMRQMMSEPQLEQLGEEVERRKEQLGSSWNPIKAVAALVTGE